MRTDDLNALSMSHLGVRDETAWIKLQRRLVEVGA